MVKFDEMKELGEKFALEFCEALNNSEAYADAGKGWGIDFDGAMLMIFQACGEIEDDVSAFCDLKDGKCLGIKLIPPGEEPPREPTLRIFGLMSTWKKIVEKELDPVQSLMSGDLHLEGEMSLAMKYARAAMQLANVAADVDHEMFNKWNLGD